MGSANEILTATIHLGIYLEFHQDFGGGAKDVKIQNRGPEQEIPAVTCVRLIAQKHRY